MRYLVTGGAGFIGSHLVERLTKEGHAVTILDDLSSGKRENIPAGVNFIQGDITTPGIFDKLVTQVDGCFHLAAIASVERSEKEWLRTHQVNVSGAVALFDAIARTKKPIPVVYASSAATYGDCPDMPLKESARMTPVSAYGADKLACEQHARIANLLHKIPTIGLRFFNVYGPRQDPASPYSGVTTIFITRMKKNQPVTINGDGKQARDFIYVDDIVEGITRAMKKLESGEVKDGAFNLCAGVATSVNELAETLAKLTDTSSIISHGPARPGDPFLSLGDPALSHQKLGFAAATKLDVGLKRLLDTL